MKPFMSHKPIPKGSPALYVFIYTIWSLNVVPLSLRNKLVFPCSLQLCFALILAQCKVLVEQPYCHRTDCLISDAPIIFSN